MTIRRLTSEEGGGHAVAFADLAGFMADNETEAGATTHAREAQIAWIAAMLEAGIDPAEGLGQRSELRKG